MTQGSPERASVERIAGITSMATRRVLAELATEFERRTGRPVAIESVGGVDAARRIEAGEAFDFVVLAAQAIDKLAAAGRIDPHFRVDVARSRIALAVRAGARRPDLAGKASKDTKLRGFPVSEPAARVRARPVPQYRAR